MQHAVKETSNSVEGKAASVLWPLSNPAVSSIVLCVFLMQAYFVSTLFPNTALVSVFWLSVSSFSIWNVMESDSTLLFYPPPFYLQNSSFYVHLRPLGITL